MKTDSNVQGEDSTHENYFEKDYMKVDSYLMCVISNQIMVTALI